MLIADFYSKPLQGKLFRISRDIILNIGSATIEDYLSKALEQRNKSISTRGTKGSSSQEWVGKNMSASNNCKCGNEIMSKQLDRKVVGGMSYAQCVRRMSALHKAAMHKARAQPTRKKNGD